MAPALLQAIRGQQAGGAVRGRGTLARTPCWAMGPLRWRRRWSGLPAPSGAGALCVLGVRRRQGHGSLASAAALQAHPRRPPCSRRSTARWTSLAAAHPEGAAWAQGLGLPASGAAASRARSGPPPRQAAAMLLRTPLAPRPMVRRGARRRGRRPKSLDVVKTVRFSQKDVTDSDDDGAPGPGELEGSVGPAAPGPPPPPEAAGAPAQGLGGGGVPGERADRSASDAPASAGSLRSPPGGAQQVNAPNGSACSTICSDSARLDTHIVQYLARNDAALLSGGTQAPPAPTAPRGPMRLRVLRRQVAPSAEASIVDREVVDGDFDSEVDDDGSHRELVERVFPLLAEAVAAGDEDTLLPLLLREAGIGFSSRPPDVRRHAAGVLASMESFLAEGAAGDGPPCAAARACDNSSYVSSVEGVFRDFRPDHGQFLRDEFSDGSERAAECDLERAERLAQGSPSFAEQQALRRSEALAQLDD
ncbi:unnamed protein product [Prorocentrum cordatum]|uniref:HEAT repeat-containing protein 1 n=1 Tax=Prorocentrum cordatum TaxID=2364126 RepID=A0ABN9V9Y5_9DINO|nr:unnamed protein product [Polarella glacialis]